MRLISSTFKEIISSTFSINVLDYFEHLDDKGGLAPFAKNYWRMYEISKSTL